MSYFSSIIIIFFFHVDNLPVGTGQKLQVFLHLLTAYSELLTHFPVFFQIQQKYPISEQLAENINHKH